MIKGKKGEGDGGLSIQQVLFYFAEIAVGAIIILLLLQVVFSASKGGEAKMIARDFESTLQTISTYSYPIYIEYPVSLSKGSINIKQDSIRLDINKGTHTTQLKLIKNIQIQEYYSSNVNQLPIIGLNNKILFSETEMNELSCERLYKFPSGQNFKITYLSINADESEYLNLFNKGLNIMHESNSNSNLKINEAGQNTQEIRISFNQESDKTNIIYNNLEYGHEGFICYTNKIFLSNDYQIISDIVFDTQETKVIEIVLPSIEHINNIITIEELKNKNINSEIDLMQYLAMQVYYVLSEIVQEQ